MPQLLPEGFPEPASRSRFTFNDWADGQVWRFVRGEDYTSTTDSFRYNVKRWAKAHGFEAEAQVIPAADGKGRALPATKAEPIGLAVRFVPAGRQPTRGRAEERAASSQVRAA